jgi:hypothetical protein
LKIGKINILNIFSTYNNVIFKKGETERILAYEYYLNSYNSCFQVKKISDVSNDSLIKNTKLMWNYVKDYSDKLGKKKFPSLEKSTNINKKSSKFIDNK